MITDHTAAGLGHGEDGDVTVRIYQPAALLTPAPVLYWVHGGGMVLGSLAMDDD